MYKEIEQKLNADSKEREIKLSGKILLNIKHSSVFTMGKLCVKGIIQITRSNIVVDGSDAEVEVVVDDCTSSDWGLFFIHPMASNVTFKNFNVKVKILNSIGSTRMFSVIYNTAFGLKVENCNIEVSSENQLNLTGIYNNGNLDTHLETRADNVVITNSVIRASCYANEFNKECVVYGIYNNLANSILLQNTYVYATNAGKGKRQKAIGVYTNGRFGRFIGNNIKANGAHNAGREKEQAHAFGFINDGLYSIITSNNIVGEWAGMSIGLDNKGEYAKISNNKILATHTICGKTVRNNGSNSSIDGNIITSTSRNARLIEHTAHNCIISRNIMEILMVQSECRSGCGIYASGENCEENIISENIIRNVLTCGVFAKDKVGKIQNNIISSYLETISRADETNVLICNKLDEKMIQSIFDN